MMHSYPHRRPRDRDRVRDARRRAIRSRAAARWCAAIASASHPTDDELAALFGLVALRLCTSVCIAADQQAQRPDNEYLGVSQRAIARTLPLLAQIPFGLAEAVFREAAGVRISPAADRVIAYLAAPAVDRAGARASTRSASRASCST